ncbi:cytochrome c [Novosphingobium hassiacum]|uniref:Cytochrome c n=1 Tax=Novosphingobium hassiacum TaxID=173676 RepID=A0A7W6EUK0_9SPHN|nr:c-type cytochrome [Novosphingobium hassiacum]MBB3859338.1 cytochrome c [Novosphingobium hassiacum]
MTILQLRDRLLPSVATILLAACSNNQQPTSDKSAAAEAAPVVSPSIAPSEVPPKTASTNAAPDEGTLSPSPSPSPSASAPGASPVSTPLTSSPATQAPEKIAQAATPPAAWARCAVCHAAEKGAPAKLGPNLYGVYGHKMGQGSYAFSDALKASALTLDDATLDKWLENPRALVPGNRMSFPGLKDAAKRAEIIAYLKQQR